MKQEIQCPICSKTSLKVEINPFNGEYFIRCCSVCLSGGYSEEEVIEKWQDAYCWKAIEDGRKKLTHLFNAYVKTRLETSGSLGNLSQDRRRAVIVHEILSELGWDTQSMK